MSKQIILTPGKACKCSCREHRGSDGKPYWVNLDTKQIYLSDCHKANPILAEGSFVIVEVGKSVLTVHSRSFRYK